MSIRYQRIPCTLLILCTLLLSHPGAAWAEAPWSEPLDLAQPLADVSDAALIIDASGSVHVVWSEQGSLYHRQRLGQVWSARQRIASGISPDLVPDATGGLYLAFVSASEMADDVYVARRTAAGVWGLPQNISQSDTDSRAPRLARAPSGGLALVWVEATPREGLIYVAQSGDGEVWSAGPLPDATGNAPVATFDALGVLNVAWEDVYDLGYPSDIFVARQQGATFSLPENVSYSPSVNSSAPALAGGAAGLYLAWQEGDPGASAIHTSRYATGGWQVPVPRSSVAANSGPCLVLSSSAGYLVWGSGVGLSQRIFDPERSIWVSQPELTSMAAGATGARLAVAARQHVIWIASSQGQPATLYYADRAVIQSHFAAVELPLVRRR